eukprot:14981299-Ditylum_brightwellii.AAC.1
MMTITPQQLMQITCEDIMMWDTFLNIDGGLLELLKTAYTMLAWEFSATGKPTIIPKHELPVNTVQVIHCGIPTKIKRVDETKALKLLGAYSALNQSNGSTIKKYTKTTMTFAKALTTCPFLCTE